MKQLPKSRENDGLPYKHSRSYGCSYEFHIATKIGQKFLDFTLISSLFSPTGSLTTKGVVLDVDLTPLEPLDEREEARSRKDTRGGLLYEDLQP